MNYGTDANEIPCAQKLNISNGSSENKKIAWLGKVKFISRNW